MLPAREPGPDFVKALVAGAHVYATKPFSLAVLLERIRALDPRHTELRTHSLRVADLTLEIIERRVFRGQREVLLTPKEFRLLEFFLRRVGKVVLCTTNLPDIL